MRTASIVVLLLALGSFGPTALEAAELWLVPDPTLAPPGIPISLRMCEGPAVTARPVALDAGNVARLQRLWKSGRVNLPPSAPEFTPKGPGVQLVALDSADRSRFCKALLVIGSPKLGDPLRWSELGQTLEIVPQSDPVALARRGGWLEVQVLFDREPLAGAEVVATPEVDARSPSRASTDEIGIVRIRLDRPGRWWISTSHTGACESCENPGPRDFSATLVLAAGPVE